MKKQSKNQVKKRTTWLWWLLLLLVCGIGTGAAPLKYTEDRLPSNLNPLYADDMYSVRVTELLFERLIGWDSEQNPEPMLATSWKVASDKKSIELTLRKGVKWHDGKPFTSKDVAFTIKAMTSRTSQLRDRYLASIISKVEPIGSHQIKISFKKKLGKPVKWLQFKIIPAHAFAKKKGKVKRTDIFSQKPIGTGIFMFSRWVGKRIKMKRFPKHWRAKKTKLARIDLQAITDKNIQVEVLRYGGIDTIVRVRPKDIPVFEKDQNIRLYPYSTNDWWYIAFNHKLKKMFGDQRVREAFVYAIDRDGLRAAHLGDGQVISGPFSPNDPLYNFSVNTRSQDIAKAKGLLDAAGWKAGANGIRKKSGKPFKVRFLVPKSKTSYKALCVAVQSSLRKVGIQVDLIWLSDATWSASVFRKKSFDMALHIWNFDDLASISPLFHSKGSQNYIGYRSKEVDALFKKANQTTDPVIYKTIFNKLHKSLHKDLPYLFLWSLTNYSAISAKVKGVTIHPFNYFHYSWKWRKKKD